MKFINLLLINVLCKSVHLLLSEALGEVLLFLHF